MQLKRTTSCMQVDDNNKTLIIRYYVPETTYERLSRQHSRWVKEELLNAGIDINIYKKRMAAGQHQAVRQNRVECQY